ncbi:MAG: MerR family transcriptional regulator [Hespellia sp.]|nr:MerR family transcriptional regulator [Hespellia sp.]
MQIQNVIQKTGLKKRTIYYYIEQGLILPRSNEINGYFIFTEEDVNQLLVISNLRRAGFSVAHMKTILQHPGAAQFYMQKQIEKMEESITRQQRILEEMKRLEDAFPIHTSAKDLYSIFSSDSLITPNVECEERFQDRNARVVCLYLWGFFLNNVPVDSYRKSLWERLCRSVAGCEQTGKMKNAGCNYTEIIKLKRTLYQLSAEAIEGEYFINQRHCTFFSKMKEESYEDYLDLSKKALQQFVQRKKQSKYWKENYENLIVPSIAVYGCPPQELLMELSPLYQPYYENIQKICSGCYRWMLCDGQGRSVKRTLENELQIKMDFAEKEYGVIASLLKYSLC